MLKKNKRKKLEEQLKLIREMMTCRGECEDNGIMCVGHRKIFFINRELDKLK